MSVSLAVVERQEEEEEGEEAEEVVEVAVVAGQASGVKCRGWSPGFVDQRARPLRRRIT